MADHVEVIGSGSASAVPDVAVLDVRVRVEAREAGAALDALAARLEDVRAATRAAGLRDADRRTTSLGLTDRRDRDHQAVVGYLAHQGLRLVVRDTGRVGDLVAALGAAAGDALGVDDIRFEVADRAPLRERARAAAFEDARGRALQYAGLAGRGLGPVLRVTEHEGAGGGPQPMTRRVVATASMPVEAGETEVGVTVLVRFALEAS
ncbi:SIMPL domain-containing protein [Phycicoccus sp. BSK3Z-2]|uniref:SIMPL domain-containing protein n=1 Tax=Phycicoccus avicenniae TaxID=2828860 RepID=A0A941D7A7_9MICO|nr:SIMPL domain-containing protein [Phycicoccus avicenniae]MBR7742936.1 SIMPL domain-containing protein [Phycicoccus avicenniae]